MAALVGRARRDLATICGRGIREGEMVTVEDSHVAGKVTITAPGGRRIPHVTLEQMHERVEPV